MRATRVELRLSALRHNLRMARQAARGSRIMAAVKADGYGHGLVRVAKALEEETDAFAVACASEALKLREAGISVPVALLEGFFDADELGSMQQYDLTTVVHHWGQIEILESHPLSRPLKIWIKVDSGMHRLGFAPEQVRVAWERLGRVSLVERVGFLTHLAEADD